MGFGRVGGARAMVAAYSSPTECGQEVMVWGGGGSPVCIQGDVPACRVIGLKAPIHCQRALPGGWGSGASWADSLIRERAKIPRYLST